MKPDKEKTTFTNLSRDARTAPRVIFGVTALRWIHAIVDIHSLEVGFYAIVDEREDYTFFIRDVFYPKHSEANGATCEISPEGETIMMNWLIDHGRDADIEKVKLWGHSHHNMGTSPSGQDEKQAIERMNATQTFLIRIICNKKGEVSVSFFDYENQVRFDHIKWEVENDLDPLIDQNKLDEIRDILDDAQEVPIEKIKKINQVTVRDDITRSIRNKVTELKSINIPPPNTISYHNSKKNENQENMFPTNSQNTQDELEREYERYVNDIDDNEKSNIDNMLNDFENGVGVTK